MILKILKIFFISLGVIFFVIILAGICLYVFDPFELKPLLFGSKSGSNENPYLSEAQENALKAIGINPSSAPSQFTPAQEECFIKILGQVRVDQIKAGDAPTAAEYFQAKECL